MSETYYDLLGIPRDSDERQIRRAYHRLARELHPDKARSPDEAESFEGQFSLISTAYNILKAPHQRAEYDLKTFGKENAAAGGTSQKTATAAVLSARRSPSAPAAAPSEPTRDAGASTPTSGRTRSTKPPADRGLTPERIAIAQKAFAKGIMLARDKDYAKAAEFFEAALANNDTEPAYHSHFGVALIEARRSASKAIAAARQAIEMDSFNQDFRFNLAHIFEVIGSKSNAIKVYEEIIRWDKDNQVAQQMLRNLTQKKGLLGKLSGPEGVLGILRKKFSGGA